MDCGPDALINNVRRWPSWATQNIVFDDDGGGNGDDWFTWLSFCFCILSLYIYTATLGYT